MVQIAGIALLLVAVIGIGTNAAKCSSNEDSNSDEGHHHHHHHHHHDYLPPFAWNASSEAQNELKNIFKNKTLTKQQIKDAVDVWAKRQGQSMVDEVANFEKDVQLEKAKRMQLSANASLMAQQALENLTAIEGNMSLTRSQEKEQIHAMFMQLPKPVAHEAKKLLNLLEEEVMIERPTNQYVISQQRFRRRAEADETDEAEEQEGESSEYVYYDFPMEPLFLEKLTPEDRKEFNNIRFNSSVSQEILMQDMRNWAEKHDSEIQAAINEMLKNMTDDFHRAEAVVAKLPVSSEVKNALQQIIAINANYTLSTDEQLEMEEEFLDSLPMEIRDEVDEKLLDLYKYFTWNIF